MIAKAKYTILSLLAIFALASCGDKSSEGLTRITYYPTIELDGGETVVVQKGTEYVEPGYTSMMNGEDVTDKVTVSSNVNTNKSGVYSITYSTMLNEDGYGSSVTRTVVVLDLEDPIEGFYLTASDSYRDYSGKQTSYGSEYETLVINNGDGTYNFEDLFGGWYCQRAGYGSSYSMEGDVAIAADGTMTLVDSYLPGWGDSVDELVGTYDYATQTFNYAVTYVSSMVFNVKMTKE